MQNFKKSLDGDDSEDEDHHHGRPGQGYNQGFGETSSYGGRRSGDARRSADRERYDADPPILSDNFASLELKDNDGTSRSGCQLSFTRANYFWPMQLHPLGLLVLRNPNRLTGRFRFRKVLRRRLETSIPQTPVRKPSPRPEQNQVNGNRSRPLTPRPSTTMIRSVSVTVTTKKRLRIKR